MKMFRLLSGSLVTLTIGLLAQTVDASPLIILPAGSVWRYSANGADQGTLWREVAFNDSAWPSGPAQLGFGDGDETTVLPSPGIVTAYFRRAFQSQVVGASSLTLRLLRDDGAVVYINGVEVFRNNMPPGPVSYTTLATATVGGAEESTQFITAQIDPNVLVQGANLVAVEVHQVNITSSDLSFDLELIAEAGPTLPTLTVQAIDPDAAELSPLVDAPLNPGVFRIRREGSLEAALQVAYALSGTASNGVDYTELSGTVELPAGTNSVDVFVDVIHDMIVEGDETVVLRLIPPACAAVIPPPPGCYAVGTNSATVVIHDSSGSNVPPTVRFASPTNGAVFVGPTNIFLNAIANDANGYLTIQTVEFFEGTRSLSIRTNYPTLTPGNPFMLQWQNVGVGEYTLTAIATDDYGARGTSAPVHIRVVGSPGEITLVPFGAVWKYMDQGIDLGTAWQQVAFDDSAWASGPAQLGYGDGDEATVVSFGPNPNNKYITTYFRRSFQIPSGATISALRGRLLQDDGGAVYLNGVEVFRGNLPPGPLPFDTLAIGASPDNQIVEFTAPASLLREGLNLLAVEMHQNSPVSSDLSFDLELIGQVAIPPPELPVVTVVATDADAAESGVLAAIFPGTFTFSRTGPVGDALTAFFTLSGSAENGVDYRYVSNSVRFNPGQAQARVDIFPLNDALVEGTENVVLTLQEPACIAIVPPPPGCYRVGPTNRAEVLIRDANSPPNQRPYVQLNEPHNGDVFTAPTNIVLRAFAHDQEDGYQLRVEFFDGTNSLGLGEFVATTCPAPFCPYYRLVWLNAPQGNHTLIARATDSLGASSNSAPVSITVRPHNPPPGTKLWEFASGSVYTPPAVGSDGTVYLAGGNPNPKLYALTPEGAVKWAAQLGTYNDGSPAIGADGTIYIGTAKALRAYSPTGTLRWSFAFPAMIAYYPVSPPAIAQDGTIYVGTGEPDRSLYALGPDGTLKWKFAAGNQFATVFAPVIGTDGTIYFGAEDDRFYALRPDGTKRWDTPMSGYRIGAAVGGDGTIYVVGSIFPNKLFAFAPSGAKKWETQIGPDYSQGSSPPTLGSDGTIYVGSPADIKLYAFNADGSPKWAFPGGTNGSGASSAPAVDTQGNVYFGLGPQFFAVSPAGSRLWSYQTAGIFTAPALTPGGILYVGNAADTAYAFQANAGLAESPWPMFQRDLRHTGAAPLVNPPNQSPRVAITRPVEGDVFEPGTIRIEAVTTDPDGYANTVEFFANEQKIGEARIDFIQPPPPGEPIHFEFNWANPPIGQHRLTARTIDNRGAPGASAPVNITVRERPTGGHELHVVGIYSGTAPDGGTSHTNEQGRTAIFVDRPGQLVTLSLSAYEPVKWSISASAGTTIEKVYVSGYYPPVVEGVGPETRVIVLQWGYYYTGYSLDTGRFYQVAPNIRQAAGLEISSFHGSYQGPYPTPFVIDQVQDDPRLHSTYPVPTPLSELPNLRFSISFHTGVGIISRAYTLAGPTDGGRLLQGDHRAVADRRGKYYALADTGLVQIDPETGAVRTIPADPNLPEISIATGLAYDSWRDRVLLVTLGGEGFLYAWSPLQERWSVLSSMNNVDIASLVYHETDDMLYGIGLRHPDYGNMTLYRWNPEGGHAWETQLPLYPWGVDRDTAELVSVGEHLVLLLRPGYYSNPYGAQADSRMYLIDTGTEQSWLTFRSNLPRPTDSDGDGVPDSVDQCPGTAPNAIVDAYGCSADQGDSDNDGVPDSRDRCLGTASGAVVNDNGCSLAQLCPCEGQWRNHAEYVSCVMQHAWEFFRADEISADQRREAIHDAVQSDCGRRPDQPEPVCIHLCPLTREECQSEGVQFVLSGDATGPCVLECSEDLVHWRTVEPVSVTGWEVTCPMEEGIRARFYRVRADQ